MKQQRSLPTPQRKDAAMPRHGHDTAGLPTHPRADRVPSTRVPTALRQTSCQPCWLAADFGRARHSSTTELIDEAATMIPGASPSHSLWPSPRLLDRVDAGYRVPACCAAAAAAALPHSLWPSPRLLDRVDILRRGPGPHHNTFSPLTALAALPRRPPAPTPPALSPCLHELIEKS
jgi:hypothetical protein